MDELLHKAIQAGDVEQTRLLLKKSANINSVLGMRGTPLCAAIYANQPTILELLLSANCDVNADDFDGEPPLCLSIRTRKYDFASTLLSKDTCNVNKVDPITGLFPLHIAVINGHLPTVQKLVDRKCRLELKDGNDNTALHCAILNNQTEIARYLIDIGCSLASMNACGELPLHTSLKMNDTDILCYIIDKVKGTDLEHLDGYKYIDYPTKAFQDTALIRATVLEKTDAVTELIRMGCDVNLANFHGDTALYIACKFNLQSIVIQLLESGADPNALAEKHSRFHLSTRVHVRYPLWEAITLGNLLVVKKLLEYGADLDLLDSSGNTALCTALVHNKPQIVDYMLDFAEKKKLSLFSIYRQENSVHVNYPLNVVASCVNPAYFAKRLLQLGADANYVGLSRGAVVDSACLQSPLLHAVQYECAELLDVLLAAGAEPQSASSLFTALQLAASEGCLSAAAVLLQWGADIDQSLPAGTSPLRHALSNANYDLAQLLLDNGARLALGELEELRAVEMCALLGGPEEDEEEEEAVELRALLSERASRPLALTFLARQAINKAIRAHGHPLSVVDTLPLPESTKHFLRFKHLDQYRHEI